MSEPLKECFSPSLLASGFRLKSCHMLDGRLALLRQCSLRCEAMRTQDAADDVLVALNCRRANPLSWQSLQSQKQCLFELGTLSDSSIPCVKIHDIILSPTLRLLRV